MQPLRASGIVGKHTLGPVRVSLTEEGFELFVIKGKELYFHLKKKKRELVTIKYTYQYQYTTNIYSKYVVAGVIKWKMHTIHFTVCNYDIYSVICTRVWHYGRSLIFHTLLFQKVPLS